MTVVKLSAKGQLVIPKSIRVALRLHPGTQLQIQLVEQKIILETLDVQSPIDALYGKFVGSDFLAELEAEHRQELNNEETGA